MDFEQKVKTQIEHFLCRRRDHIREYERFAGVLESAEYRDVARYIWETIITEIKSIKSLEDALSCLIEKPQLSIDWEAAGSFFETDCYEETDIRKE